MEEHFSSRLEEAGFDPHNVKLLRHDKRALDVWQRGKDHFLSFVSIQNADRSPAATDPDFIAHFLPGPEIEGEGFSAYFVGITKLHGRWAWDNKRFPRSWVNDYWIPSTNAEAADQSWEVAMQEDIGRVVINWGYSPRAWHQWGSRIKPIVSQDEKKLPTLKELCLSGGTTKLLSSEEKYISTLLYEENSLEATISNSPEIVDRAFENPQVTVESRPEQRKFRAALLKRHGASCCVSDCLVEEALEAAHIIPFSEKHAERNNLSNGLLLRRDIHRLFDLYLLAIDPDDRSVWIAPKLLDTEYTGFQNKSFDADASASALREHFRRAQTKHSERH